MWYRNRVEFVMPPRREARLCSKRSVDVYYLPGAPWQKIVPVAEATALPGRRFSARKRTDRRSQPARDVPVLRAEGEGPGLPSAWLMKPSARYAPYLVELTWERSPAVTALTAP